MHKKVLIITTPFRPNVGGVETHLNDLISQGVAKGVNFEVITYQPLITETKGSYFEKGRGFRVIRIPWPRFNLFLRLEKYPPLEFLYLFPGLFVAGFIYLLLRRDFGVIHGQGLIAGAVSVILGKLFRKRVVLSTHSLYNFPRRGIYKRFARFIFSQSDHILTLSRESKKEIEHLGVVKDTPVTTFTYWVDQKVFSPMDKRKARLETGLPHSVFICLFVGRLVEVKGVREFVAAAKMTPEAVFAIIGDGPMAEFVERKAKTTKNLLFLGKVDNTDLPVYYNASNVLIVPSTHDEGFGRVILEALSCGVPVIGANRGAIPEALTSDVGMLIDVSPKTISDSVNKLVSSPTKIRSLSKKARKFSLRRYSSKNISTILRYY